MIQLSRIKIVSYTVFHRIEVAPKFRPPSIRSLFKKKNFVLKAIAHRIFSNIGSKITAKNGKSYGNNNDDVPTNIHEEQIA